MADGDVIERRRELRRRKILENSENRLRKLTAFDGNPKPNGTKEIHSLVASEVRHESHCNLKEIASEVKRNDDIYEENVDLDASLMRGSEIKSVLNDIDSLTKIFSENEVVTKRVDAENSIETSTVHPKHEQNLILKPILTWRKSIIFVLAILSLLSSHFLSESTLNDYILAPITTLEALILFTEYLMEDGSRRQNQDDMVTTMLLMFVGRKGVKFHSAYKVFTRVFEDYSIFFFTYFMCHFWIENIVY